MRLRSLAALTSAALALTLGIAAPGHADPRATFPVTVPASGTFSFTTANGILPTWASEDIILVGVSPGTVTSTTSNLTARVSVPIIAKTGTAASVSTTPGRARTSAAPTPPSTRAPA